MELQADCYAGVWSKLADDAGNVSIGEAEVQQAQDAAAAVGDDRIQQQTQGRVDPESWTHGSAAAAQAVVHDRPHDRRRQRLRHLQGAVAATGPALSP